MAYVPGERSIAAVNIDRVRRERRLALGSIIHKGGQSNANAMATIADFSNTKPRVDRNQDDMDQPLSQAVNKLMGTYQMEGKEYIFTSDYKHAFFMTPFQAEQLANSPYIFVDITYTGNKSMTRRSGQKYFGQFI